MIDFSFLAKLTGNDVSKMKRYISMYLSTSVKIFERMQINIKDENWAELSLNAHSIRPQSDYMGIESLKLLLIAIEKAVSDKNYQEINPLFQKAIEIHEKSLILLSTRLTELNSDVTND